MKLKLPDKTDLFLLVTHKKAYFPTREIWSSTSNKNLNHIAYYCYNKI